MSNTIYDIKLRDFVNQAIVPLIEGINVTDATLSEVGERVKYAFSHFFPSEDDKAKLIQLQRDLYSRRQVEVTGFTVRPEAVKNLAPVGINNAGGNDCWANAIIQFIANAPGIARKVLTHRNGNCRVFASQLQSYYDAQIQAKELSNVNSQITRNELVPNSGQKQVDASEGILGLLSKITFGFQIYQEIEAKDQPPSISEQKELETMISLCIKKDATFNEQFADYFTAILDDGRTKRTQFENPPSDLIFHVKRFGQRHDLALEGISETFELPSEYTRYNEPDVQYALTGCMIHLGKDDSGHYTALEKKPDGWYLANDSVVEKISTHTAHQLLKTGYIFHYQKLKGKPSRSCGSIIYSIVKPLFKAAYYPVQFVRSITGTN